MITYIYHLYLETIASNMHAKCIRLLNIIINFFFNKSRSLNFINAYYLLNISFVKCFINFNINFNIF